MPRNFLRPIIILTIFLTACAGPANQTVPTTRMTPVPTRTQAPLPTAPLTHTPIPTPIVYDGDWSGTTDSGGTIQFTIQNNAVVSLRVNFGFSTNNASCNVDSNTTISPGHPISGDGFQIDIPSLKLTSVFNSPTAASGTLAASADSRRCHVSVNLTWTAEKQ